MFLTLPKNYVKSNNEKTFFIISDIILSIVFCSVCGVESDSKSKVCKNCKSLLISDKYFNINELNSFAQIANDENIEILKASPVTETEYEIILENIRRIALRNLERHDLSALNTIDKIRVIASSYAKITYKSKGAEFGSYSYNRIRIDDRLADCDIIATLIHELAHHLLSEIFEQMLMLVWEVKKTYALEAFVSFILGTNPIYVLINEYCAHTVEGRFIPHGYQKYASFNRILTEEFDLENDAEVIDFALMMGNSMADDIIRILENFIGDDLRDEIKLVYQRNYNNPPNYDEILLESDEVYETAEKLKHLHIILISGIIASKDEESYELLRQIKKDFIENNG